MELAAAKKQNSKENKIDIGKIFRDGLAFVALIVLAAFFGALTRGKFLTVNNLLTILLQITPYAMLGFGLTYVLITGGTDLSAGSVVGFGGIVCAKLLINGVPIVFSILAGVAAGAVAGLINGLIITKLGVVPFIATLGTQFAFRGLTQLVGAGKPVSIQSMENKQIVNAFKFIGGGTIFGKIPFPVIIIIVFAVVFGIVLAKTGFGRRLFAVGSNEETARLSGIDVVKTKITAYMISGATAGFAGVLLASRLASAQSNAGQNYEFEGIAAAVIGGTSVAGGEGSILGTVIGALVMGFLRNGLNLLKVNAFVQMVIIGAIIVAGVWYDTMRRKKQG